MECKVLQTWLFEVYQSSSLLHSFGHQSLLQCFTLLKNDWNLHWFMDYSLGWNKWLLFDCLLEIKHQQHFQVIKFGILFYGSCPHIFLILFKLGLGNNLNNDLRELFKFKERLTSCLRSPKMYSISRFLDMCFSFLMLSSFHLPWKRP